MAVEPVEHDRASRGVIRAIVWQKDDLAGCELAEVMLRPRSLVARGVAIGSTPLAYRLVYVLATRRDFVTSRLRVTARGAGWRRTLDLRRSLSGMWTAIRTMQGVAALAPPGGADDLSTSVLDCDLSLSPLTNTMPVLRHGLLNGGSPVELEVAWVSVPDLAVIAMAQRYTHLGRTVDGPIVRYEDASFAADISFDAEGLVVDYPGLARRVDHP